MAKLDIDGGLLGAGKTTLIRAMLQCAYRGKRVAVIENEIGRVNLDAGAFSGVTVRPLTAGCVCCILKGDLVTAVRELLQGVAPEYIVMEASGAADLEAIRRICAEIDGVSLNRCVMVVNARKLRKLMTVVGEFYRIQLRDAADIYLNFTEGLPRTELDAVRQLLREINPSARLIDTPIDQLETDTLPEGDAGTAPPTPRFKPVPVRALRGRQADAVKGDRPALTVLDPSQLPSVLPAGRFLRDFGSPAPGKHSGTGIRAVDAGKTLYTLTLSIPAPPHRAGPRTPPAAAGPGRHLARQGLCDDVGRQRHKARLRLRRLFHNPREPRRGSRIECARADRRGPPGAVGSGCGRAVLWAAYYRTDELRIQAAHAKRNTLWYYVVDRLANLWYNVK